MKVKSFIVLLFSVLYSNIFYAQTFEVDLKAKMLRNNGCWKKNSDVTITKVVHSTVKDEYNIIHDLFYLEDSQGNKVDINSKVDDCFDFHFDNVQQLWDASIITNVLYNLKKKGFQYDMRSEMESDALDYIQKVRNYGLELDDPFLKTYIYSLIATIAPNQLIDGRPGSINLIIQENPSINACCYPNGTIVLNTGLLAVLHSEDELVAILAHEIAHFVLDHSVQNVNAAIARQKRAEFWAAIATGITAAAEGYVASKNDYYVPGAATLGMAILSTSIASQVIDRLGLKYNHEQESAADKLAVEILKILGYNHNALSTALSRLEAEYIKERNNAVYVNSYTHPALVERIAEAGTKVELRDKYFEQIISFAVTSVALMKYSDCRFRQCLPYVSQNITNEVATADDYLLKANCLLSTKNDNESNETVLWLIDKAKNLDPNNLNVFKTEIIAVLRIGNKVKALETLDSYVEKLNSYDFENIKSDATWDKLKNFVAAEKKWASRMQVKLSGMNF